MQNFQRNFSRVFSLVFDMDYRTAQSCARTQQKLPARANPRRHARGFHRSHPLLQGRQRRWIPSKLCSEYTIRLARLSQYFPDGVSKHFHKLYTSLREKRELMLDVKTALDVAYNVLKSGPRAPENFYSAYAYAGKKMALSSIKRTRWRSPCACRIALTSAATNRPTFLPPKN